MKANFKKIKKQLLVLYYLLSDKNDIGPQRKQLFIQAINMNISKSRKNNPLVVQLANELAATMLIIEDQREVIKELYRELNNPARYYHDIENILQHDSNRYEVLRKLNVQKDGEDDFLPVGFNPKDIICIITAPPGKKKDARRKVIYEKIVLPDKSIEINKYYLNSQKLHYNKEHSIALNFDSLRHYVDLFQEYLVQVSQSAIVNIDYYDFETNRCLLLNIDAKEIDVEAIKIILSDRNTDLRQVKQEILKIRKNRYARSFSHEKAEYYINTFR